MKIKKISDDQRLEQLETMPVVKYYISFSAKSGLEQHNIIKDYDLYLKMSEESNAGKLYLETRKALATNDMETVRVCGSRARDILANGDYELAPQPFDPKFIGNQAQVAEYRQLIAKTTGDIPQDFKEALLD